jgi:hypothetical protein
LTAGGAGTPGLRLPMIVMVAAQPEQHEMRYSEPGDATNIARKLRLSEDLLERGQVEGVVTYCAPKQPSDPIFRAVQETYAKSSRGR